MKLKIPEIKRTLQLVRHIQEKHEASEDFGAHYSLSEMLYGRAKVTPDGTVCLWLGANVMVEYPYDEAISILELSLKNACLRRDICEEDLDMVRDQIITNFMSEHEQAKWTTPDLISALLGNNKRATTAFAFTGWRDLIQAEKLDRAMAMNNEYQAQVQIMQRMQLDSVAKAVNGFAESNDRTLIASILG